MTAGVFNICGASGGDVARPNENNRTGTFENARIRDNIIKPYLMDHNLDPRGQNPLPDIHKLKPMPDLRKKMEAVIRQDGCKSGNWYYKGTQIALIWPVFMEYYRDAYWIIVRRNRADIINSCLRTSYMNGYWSKQGWGTWHDTYCERFEELKVAVDEGQLFEVSPENFVRGNYEEIRGIIERLGLEWNETKVRDFVAPELWRNKKHGFKSK